MLPLCGYVYILAAQIAVEEQGCNLGVQEKNENPIHFLVKFDIISILWDRNLGAEGERCMESRFI